MRGEHNIIIIMIKRIRESSTLLIKTKSHFLPKKTQHRFLKNTDLELQHLSCCLRKIVTLETTFLFSPNPGHQTVFFRGDSGSKATALLWSRPWMAAVCVQPNVPQCPPISSPPELRRGCTCFKVSFFHGSNRWMRKVNDAGYS